MGHAHDHVHEDDHGAYYLEQLCTIGMSAGLGLLAVLVYWRGCLEKPVGLNPVFHPFVLWGGIIMLVFAAVRAVAVWIAAGQPASCQTAHAHDHGCRGHDHDREHSHDHDGHDHEHDHDLAAGTPHTHALPVLAPARTPGHDHGHDHGWAPWRYVVLLLPIVLCFLFLFLSPIRELHATSTDIDVGRLDGDANVAVKGDKVEVLGFPELQDWARDRGMRQEWEGKIGRLKGQFVPGRDDHQFSLARFRIRCCAADAIQLNAVLYSKERIDVPTMQGQWVEVEGVIQFHKRLDREEYVPVLIVRGRPQVVDPDPSPYLY